MWDDIDEFNIDIDLDNKFQMMLDFIWSKIIQLEKLYITSGDENIKIEVYNFFIH